ncbi:PKD domain-containing protein [Krasilnikovia sp. MM14-A1259]|uniref:PKD domain-containing protein n=1 Tax=Krasilnikovia sp. MM14-A1259 TaxID=3373539 RepID=UPI00380E261B
MKITLARLPVTLGVIAAVLAPMAGTAVAVAVTPAAPRTGKLTQVGPIADHGFPAWYRDSNNVRLELCTTADDPMCPAPAGSIPNPDAPVSFPDNFPDESFYQLATATVTLDSGAKAVVSTNLEAAFMNGAPAPGDQMVFGRIRIRFDAAAGERFRITHPYGVDDVVADAKKGVNMTEDTGAIPGAFGAALNGRVGPFLKWDGTSPQAPAGYIGNPGIDHPITGSPYNTNFVQIDQLDPDTGALIKQVGKTSLFSLQGRYATNSGLDVDQATYSRAANGTGAIDVYASSEPNQVLQITGNTTMGFHDTKLRGSADGHYYGRFPLTGTLPANPTVDVANITDRPATHKTRALVDLVSGASATYNADTQKLTVAATSSDKKLNPALTAVGFGAVTPAGFTGVVAPPAAITITSAAGGSTTVPVVSSGANFVPTAPVAAATADTPALVNQTVRLDASGSVGEITKYTWTQTGGAAVTLTNAATKLATFAPKAAGLYTFRLQVDGPGGTSQATVAVTVTNVTAPKADAGVDQTVVRGKAVTLDGSKSTAAETYSWAQVSGPAVTLTGASSAKPSFTFPTQALPASPGPNAGFVYNNDPVVLELTIRNAAGISTDQVVVTPQAETLSGLTVRYRTGNNEWRISGTSSLLQGQRVAVVLGSTLTGRVIGTGTVDAAGAFSIRVTGPVPATNPAPTVSFVTTTGASQLGFAVSVTN